MKSLLTGLFKLFLDEITILLAHKTKLQQGRENLVFLYYIFNTASIVLCKFQTLPKLILNSLN